MLHIWLPKQQGQLHTWQSKTDDWQVVDSWQKISEIATSKQVCLYFPSVHLLSTQNNMPAAKFKQLGQTGVQYLFEDISLTPVEQLQVRQLNVANNHYLYALAQQDIEQWQNSASLAGLNIQLLLPDFLLLPAPKTGANASYLYHDEQTQTTLLRQSQVKGVGVAALPLLPKFLMSDMLSEAQLDDSIKHSDEQSNDEQNEPVKKVSVITSKQPPQTVFDDAFLSLLAANNIKLEMSDDVLKPISTNHHPLNFVAKKSNSKLSATLKAALVVALLAIGTQLLVDGVSKYRYAQSVKQVDNAINRQYQSWFPEERLNSKTSLQLQLKSKLTAGSLQNESVFKTLDKITPLIKTNAVGVTSVEANSNKLALFLVANNRSNIDNLMKAFNDQGLQASLGTVSNAVQANQSASQIGANANNKVAAKVTITNTNNTSTATPSVTRK